MNLQSKFDYCIITLTLNIALCLFGWQSDLSIRLTKWPFYQVKSLFHQAEVILTGLLLFQFYLSYFSKIDHYLFDFIDAGFPGSSPPCCTLLGVLWIRVLQLWFPALVMVGVAVGLGFFIVGCLFWRATRVGLGPRPRFRARFRVTLIRTGSTGVENTNLSESYRLSNQIIHYWQLLLIKYLQLIYSGGHSNNIMNSKTKS